MGASCHQIGGEDFILVSTTVLDCIPELKAAGVKLTDVLCFGSADPTGWQHGAFRDHAASLDSDIGAEILRHVLQTDECPIRTVPAVFL